MIVDKRNAFLLLQIQRIVVIFLFNWTGTFAASVCHSTEISSQLSMTQFEKIKLKWQVLIIDTNSGKFLNNLSEEYLRLKFKKDHQSSVAQICHRIEISKICSKKQVEKKIEEIVELGNQRWLRLSFVNWSRLNWDNLFSLFSTGSREMMSRFHWLGSSEKDLIMCLVISKCKKEREN